jgi:hypothetical protein
MCLIIDINALAPVFDSKNTLHNEFEPVKSWILEGRGKVVYGGSKYLAELSKTKYLGLFLQLRKAEKACYVENKLVDEAENDISAEISSKDFDDQHLVALLLVSRCKLICSLDKRAYPYFTNSKFFKPTTNRPKIYRQKSNSDLLCPQNMAEICLPCNPTTKLQRKQIPL